MYYTIKTTDLILGSYQITFDSETNEIVDEKFYKFETPKTLLPEKIVIGLLAGYKNIPNLTIKENYPNFDIKYEPDNLLRIIDRANKVINSLYEGGYKNFDDYETLFANNLLPYGRFIDLDFEDIKTDKETCGDVLYNAKIINEQINDPKNSLSNCLNHLKDTEYWRDEKILHEPKPEPDYDVKILREIIESQKRYIKKLQNYINELEYKMEIKHPDN